MQVVKMTKEHGRGCKLRSNMAQIANPNSFHHPEVCISIQSDVVLCPIWLLGKQTTTVDQLSKMLKSMLATGQVASQQTRMPTNWVTHPLQIPSGSTMLHITEQIHHNTATNMTIIH
uniref:Uncharacterized protein n=1 Tax=Salix viminalis TaxID=40686 RepID=A0A6N2MWK1_SALVM